MMPGPHISPSFPSHQGRRQGDYHYQYPAQHSPIPPNPYYAQPPYHTQPHASAYVQQPQWYSPYPQQHQQYNHVSHRPYVQPHGPVVVSSHPHLQSAALNRQFVTTPPVLQSRTPPAQLPTATTPQPIPAAPPTPSTTSQQAASPTPTPTSTTSTATPPPPSSTRSSISVPTAPVIMHRKPYYPPLPWLSVPEKPFPPRARRRRRRREAIPASEALELPSREHDEGTVQGGNLETTAEADLVTSNNQAEELEESVASTLPPASDHETPMTSEAPSDGESTYPTTPSSVLLPASQRVQSGSGHTRTATRPAIPIIPIKSVVPQAPVTQSKGTASIVTSTAEVAEKPQDSAEHSTKAEQTIQTDLASPTSEQTPTITSPTKTAPKSWADLVRTKASAAKASASATVPNGASTSTGPAKPSNSTLADVLRSFTVGSGNKISFVEPRGLVNTGNMCYMNSILQVLVFCIPFFDFLDQVGKRAAHSFKSDTPLLDAMIMLLGEFKVIDSAESAQQLRLRLKDAELEQYGEAFTPEFVYDVIKRLPRFSHMRRGHQQDAEEFLGFLLAGLHDECVQVMKSNDDNSISSAEITSPTSTASTDAGWMEVGHKQKSAVTRSSGAIEIESPVTKIFGGKLRSEFRVPGLKPSVTTEPYQPLQLDIGSPDVHNIVDALKGLTHSETIQGNFNSPRGPGTSAIKQVSIESVPPVLILHLKRFQYDNTGGTQKIWKKIGYPLELELPKEVFGPYKRSSFTAQGSLPRYRLIGVVYHHGKNAGGGHYTVDVRRQEGREWIRLDDTIIRRVRSEDVAEGGSEEDPRVLAAALEQHKHDSNVGKNIYNGLDEDDEKSSEGGWKEVSNGPTAATAQAGKKWSGIVNGTATPNSAGKRTPKERPSIKDNKVAYILFYEQVSA